MTASTRRVLAIIAIIIAIALAVWVLIGNPADGFRILSGAVLAVTVAVGLIHL